MTPLCRLRSIPLASIAAFSATLALAPLGAPQALAQDAIYAPGELIVTGFPGVVPPEALPDGADPLDYTFIDIEAPSMQIVRPTSGDSPVGQLIASPQTFSANASDIGLVFGTTLDNAHEIEDALAPNIYLGATAAFGLHLVTPDADGNPVRTTTGGPDASYMPGQWGSAGGVEGYPGSVWKVDGETGEISLFTTVAANTGAGLGDIEYDPSTYQFFVSDLDTGLIYRLDAEGLILDTYDHGVDGRPTHELDPVEDDGSAVDIADPAFNTEDPSTWGFTQPERRVIGLETRGGRLYYTAFDGERPQVWSVRIQADGSFGAPRWELDVEGLLSNNELTGILFDPQGRMIVAQRGPQIGSYDYSVFAQPETSMVVRYEREYPDNPATPGTWMPEPEPYAIGFTSDGAQASGGIALGPKFNEETGAFDGACDAFLWSSGDSLRFSGDVDVEIDPPAEVAGLQGNHRALVLPQQAPLLAFFVDYDGGVEDEESVKAGHVGTVAVWQDCAAGDAEYVEPPFLPEEDDDEDFDDDEEEEYVNLTLEKWASPYFCFDGGANWLCSFTIRVENTGDEPYWGPVVVDDYLPDDNAGATMDFWPQPPWSCNPTGATSYQCVTGPVLLFPGDGVVLHEVVKLPKAMVGYCDLPNAAGLNWFWDDDDDSSDDFDFGVAGIKAPGCFPPDGPDLSLEKVTWPANCFDIGTDWSCWYRVEVQNSGTENFTGPITVTDTLSVNAPATAVGPWTCVQAGPILTCTINAAPVNVPPGWTSGFFVNALVPKNVGAPLCDLENEGVITTPAGGSPTNVDASNDFDSATAQILEPACLLPQPETDIEIDKDALGCTPFVYLAVPGYLCEWRMTITNVGPDPFNDVVAFSDTSAGATLNTLTMLLPFCTGGPTVVDCTTPGAVPLGPGIPETLSFHTFYPDGPTACSATNNLSILTPNPGSEANPVGNDSDSVGQALPNPACAGLPHLNIQKTAKGCGADPSSPDWLCVFDVAVLNFGAAPQVGPIDVYDFNDKPTTFDGAACVPAGPGAWKCTLPGPLNPGDTWTFEATTRVNPNSVSLADCLVTNTVWITNPPSADPGHLAQANDKVPMLQINLGPGPVAVYCDPPSLALTKTHVKTVKSGDGYDSTFTVRATSTGPDPYIGTVEVGDDLPDGTSFVESTNWSCVPTIDNNVHCSSAFKTIPVGKYTEMTITIHIPADVAIAAKCEVVNTVNASISAEVLHSDEGVQYTASAAAELPASLCRPPEQCPVNQVMPGGDCCEDGTVWNGKQCAEPPPSCPRDSRIVNGECVCDRGTEGEPGNCEPIQSEPACPRDSRIVNGECVCDPGTEGRPGRCTEIEEEEPELVCPKDSRLVDGECECRPGTEGRPGRCAEIEEEEPELVCPKDSRLVRGECQCLPGTEGRPGRCVAVEDEPEELVCPKDSRVLDGTCVCRRGTEGTPGNCRPIEQEEEEPVTQACPKDSTFDTRRNRCVCTPPLRGEPGNCVGLQINPEILENRPILRLPTIK